MEGEGDGEEKIPYRPTKVPFGIERHLDFIDISQGGHLLLGSSNLTGKYWNGSIFYYKEANLALEDGKWLTGHNCESGVTSGKFLETEDKVIVGEDSGAVTVFTVVQLEGDDIHFVPQMYATHHDASVLSIDVSPQKEQAVSAGSDLCINVWDIPSLTALHRYWPVHARSVTSVSCKPSSQSLIFASCSLDGVALLWDPRMAKPATVLKENEGEGLTAVAWSNTRGLETVLIGNQFGQITVVEPRQANVPILSQQIFERPIHNMAAHKTGFVAICGDTESVVVWDLTSTTLIYQDEKKHEGFVRSVCWHPKTDILYSCGLDRRVVSHSALPPSVAA